MEKEPLEASGPGPGIPLVSWRPPDRAAWSRLGRSSKRVREGEMELRWIAPAPDQAQRMAVRLRRKNGPAPLRNRIRRILRELHRARATAIGEVWMLWTFVPGRLRMPTRDLRATAERLLAKAGLLAPKSP
jgi:ribonuclease P protein component